MAYEVANFTQVFGSCPFSHLAENALSQRYHAHALVSVTSVMYGERKKML